MTSTSVPATGTVVSSWLLAPTADARIRLEQVVSRAADDGGREARLLRNLGAAARRALVEEVEARLRTALSETVADLVVDGWRTYAAVKQAARKSRTEPGVDQIVPLRNHTITVDRRYDLDIAVDGVRVLTLAAQLVVRLQLYDAVAVVRDGHLVAVRSGQATAGGTVTVQGVPVAQQTLTFPLTAELTLRRPRDLGS